MKKKTLTASKNFEIRFSEVDSMNFVWHVRLLPTLLF